MNQTETFARFPLVARPRPACAPLEARVRHLCDLARSAERSNDRSTASTVFNQAALLASDLGLPELARDWCHQHADIYLRARPLDGTAARHALEPLVNLVRLRIRAGEGTDAFEMLNSLYEAVTTSTDTVIDGLHVPISELTATANDHRELLQWLWTVHLADGTRALTAAGRWQDALDHLRHRNGIGQRMLDGRQVAVIAHTMTGELVPATELLEATQPGEPWEDAVTVCLAVLCRPQGSESEVLPTLLDRYRRLDHAAPGLVMFRTRLGLSVIDALGGVECPEGRAVADVLIRRVVASQDGYAARELLGHPGFATSLGENGAVALTRILQISGLERGQLPEALMRKLVAALASSSSVIIKGLAVVRPIGDAQLSDVSSKATAYD
ncbi:hypothetical protein [Microbispora bryophytorum]|uniref:Uncharacterized protein n=1 Tax=Microbispora bryophytorum TaxID=1460882 RepID=A0A8H9L8B8_9ACTN|nr:hypothetical protein [Microbispora bryophytorum]MBD3135726.1 hypothetical protein [Microbispora bryophytorum]GGN99141.1 hypothetical protein GCM10011574_04460 [Microbispora bryophytorum]